MLILKSETEKVRRSLSNKFIMFKFILKFMTDYTAEDGLNVLNYMGITNITEREKAVFREKWDEFYLGRNQDLIGTTWTLYAETLPFICGNGDRGSFMVAQIRDSDFGERLEITGLDTELKQGVPFEDILKIGPHKFYETVRVE